MSGGAKQQSVAAAPSCAVPGGGGGTLVGDQTGSKCKFHHFELMVAWYHRHHLLTAVPTSPGSTSAYENSLSYDVGPHRHDCHVSTYYGR